MRTVSESVNTVIRAVGVARQEVEALSSELTDVMGRYREVQAMEKASGRSGSGAPEEVSRVDETLAELQETIMRRTGR